MHDGQLRARKDQGAVSCLGQHGSAQHREGGIAAVLRLAPVASLSHLEGACRQRELPVLREGWNTDKAQAPQYASLPPASGAGALAQLCLPPQNHLATVTS